MNPLRILLLVLLTLVFGSQVSAQSTLPREVQADLMQKEIMQLLREKDFSAVNQKFKEYEALGVKMPGPLLMTRIQVSYKVMDYEAAQKQLEEYLSTAERGTKGYDKALTMYADINIKMQKHNAAQLASVLPEMVAISAGSYRMGCQRDSDCPLPMSNMRNRHIKSR